MIRSKLALSVGSLTNEYRDLVSSLKMSIQWPSRSLRIRLSSQWLTTSYRSSTLLTQLDWLRTRWSKHLSSSLKMRVDGDPFSKEQSRMFRGEVLRIYLQCQGRTSWSYSESSKAPTNWWNRSMSRGERSIRSMVRWRELSCELSS